MLLHNQTKKLPMYNTLPPERHGCGIEKLKGVSLVSSRRNLFVLFVASTRSMSSGSFVFIHVSSAGFSF